ncbi:MAG TPA: hypothetical protein VE130_16055 [Nitrososphaeraceae archaeon]|nr:hypothetical protein [Nitrososphaeraceae archaeon]
MMSILHSLHPKHILKMKGGYRKEYGESVTDESWVIRNLWEVTSPNHPKELANRGFATIPLKLHSSGIKRLMERSQWAQGIRKKLEKGKKRHEFQADHGFRKWFKTRCSFTIHVFSISKPR